MTPPATKGAPALVKRRTAAARVAALFDQNAGMVLGLCRLLLRDHHEAEDAAQQTFVSAYRSLLRGTEPRDPAPWLAAIARNECRARIRKRMRAPLALEGELEEQLSDPLDLAEETDRRAELAALTAAIAELPARQREAVALRDFLGLSYEEVASRLSVSVPVVESLLFRARRRLRDSVRTVPRYAAGLVALPFALRAAFSRESLDLDSAGAAGVAGIAGAALAGVVAKVVSLPFAGKAATAVTVVAAATVGPHLGTGHHGRPSPATGGQAVIAATTEGRTVPEHVAPALEAAAGGSQSAPAKSGAGSRGSGSTPAPADVSGASTLVSADEGKTTKKPAGHRARHDDGPASQQQQQQQQQQQAGEPQREIVGDDQAAPVGTAPAETSPPVTIGATPAPGAPGSDPSTWPVIGLPPAQDDSQAPAPATTPVPAPATTTAPPATPAPAEGETPVIGSAPPPSAATSPSDPDAAAQPGAAETGTAPATSAVPAETGAPADSVPAEAGTPADGVPAETGAAADTAPAG